MEKGSIAVRIEKLTASLDKLETTMNAYEQAMEKLVETMPKYVSGMSQTGLSWQAIDLPGVNEAVKHPMTGDTHSLWSIIINLNDSHHWTRERIADWVETLDIDTRFTIKENHEQG